MNVIYKFDFSTVPSSKAERLKEAKRLFKYPWLEVVFPKFLGDLTEGRIMEKKMLKAVIPKNINLARIVAGSVI